MTALCIAYPAQVIDFDGVDAIVDMGGRRRRASMRMRPDVAIGDWVLVGAGSVLRAIDAAEAAELAQALDAAIATTDARPASSSPGGPR
jgi:hydrogenase expression/formation protein HypC